MNLRSDAMEWMPVLTVKVHNGALRKVSGERSGYMGNTGMINVAPRKRISKCFGVRRNGSVSFWIMVSREWFSREKVCDETQSQRRNICS